MIKSLFKKKIVLALTVIALLALTAGVAYALTGVYGPQASSPAVLTTYYKDTWSNTGYWDLTNNTNIPSNATVAGIKLEWTTSPTSGYSGMVFALSNGNGSRTYYPTNNVWLYDFNGESVRQNWNAKFKVSAWNFPGSALNAMPKITISWSAP